MSCMSFMPWPDELGGRVAGNEGTEGIFGCSAMGAIVDGIEGLAKEKEGEVFMCGGGGICSEISS